MASSFTILIFLLSGGSKNPLEVRLKELADPDGANPPPNSMAQLAQSALPKMGTPLLPKNEEERTRLQTRLIHAGYYSKQAMAVFFGVKVLLMVTPAALGLLAGLAGVAPIANCLIVGALFGVVGMIGP